MTAVRPPVITPAFSQSGKGVRWDSDPATHDSFGMVLEGVDTDSKLADDDRSSEGNMEASTGFALETQPVLFDWDLSSQNQHSRNDLYSEESRGVGDQSLPRSLAPSSAFVLSQIQTDAQEQEKSALWTTQTYQATADYDPLMMTSPPALPKSPAGEDRVHVEKAIPAVFQDGEPHTDEGRPIANEATDQPDSLLVPSLALQVLSQISTSLPQSAALPPALVSVPRIHTPVQYDAPRTELRLLRFVLQPDSLGDVEVSLRRTGQDTSVTITVMAGTAAETLGRDMVLLEDKLGALLGPSSSGSLTISMEVRDTELDQGQFMQPGGGRQGSDGAQLPSGRGSGRDGRSHSHDQREPLRTSGDRYHEKDNPIESAIRDRRIV